MSRLATLPRSILFASAGLTIGGGISNLAGSTLRSLDSYRTDGHIDQLNVLVLHGKEFNGTPQAPGRVSVAASSNARFARQYLDMGRKARVDLTLFDTIGIARSTRVMPAAIRAPYIVFAHGQELDPPVRRQYLRPLQDAAGILTVSRTTRAKLMELRRDIKLPPVEVVSPCVSQDRIDAWSGVLPKDQYQGERVVLTVGRLDAHQPGKGHDTLIAAMPIIQSRIPNVRLVIVGDGSKRESLQRLAREARVDAIVEFVGTVSDRRLGDLYRSASLFAMPSQQEGFGIVYAEAMWHGLPCVGSTADAAIDVIVHGNTGLLVPYGDVSATAEAIVDILVDTDCAQRLGENGRSRCRELYTPMAYRERLLRGISTICRKAQLEPY